MASAWHVLALMYMPRKSYGIFSRCCRMDVVRVFCVCVGQLALIVALAASKIGSMLFLLGSQFSFAHCKAIDTCVCAFFALVFFYSRIENLVTVRESMAGC